MAIIEAIETLRLEADASSVTFDSLAGYEHLQLRFSMATDSTGGDWKSILIQFNDDTASNYHFRQLYAYGSSNGSFGSTLDSTRNGWMSTYQANSMAPIVYGGGFIIIPDYLNANKNTAVLETGGTQNKPNANRGIQGTSWAIWDNTAAITKIKLSPQNDNWKQGTFFTMYGIKSS
jgi:hypothetical protein